MYFGLAIAFAIAGFFVYWPALILAVLFLFASLLGDLRKLANSFQSHKSNTGAETDQQEERKADTTNPQQPPEKQAYSSPELYPKDEELQQEVNSSLVITVVIIGLLAIITLVAILSLNTSA